jgi:hypothetical protein
MGISEEKEAYFCFRQPAHAGHHFVALLVRLGLDRDEATRLLNQYRLRGAQLAEPEEKPAPAAVASAWDRMLPASESPAMMEYLRSRGFDDPHAVAERYDLRYTGRSKHAGRLLIPLHDGQMQTSWTGRAILPDVQPKYKMQEIEAEGLICCPRPPRREMVLVEGPIDALKLAVAGELTNTYPVALTGLHLGGARLWRIAALGARRGFLALDSTTGYTIASRMLAELRMAMPDTSWRRAALPADYKDAGELPLAEATDWLRSL